MKNKRSIYFSIRGKTDPKHHKPHAYLASALGFDASCAVHMAIDLDPRLAGHSRACSCLRILRGVSCISDGVARFFYGHAAFNTPTAKVSRGKARELGAAWICSATLAAMRSSR